MNEKRISVEPLSYGMTGFRIDDLFSKKFIEELKKEKPTSVIAHFCIGFTDSKNMVAVSHDRIEGKFVLDRVDVEGEGADAEQRIKCVVEILKKVLTQMTQIGIALENRHHCSCFGLYEKKLVADKYDFGLRRLRWGDIEESNAVDLRAILGRQIVSKLPTRLRIENNGRFIAVTYTGKVLAVCDTLGSLNEEIAGMHLKENYYIERLGHNTIAQIQWEVQFLSICTLPYEGKCELNVVIDIHGTKKELSVLVDTGFTSGTGFGLKLPAEFARFAKFTGTGYVRVADGREVAADTIPDVKIMQIGDHKFDKDGVIIPTLFMSGPRAIGVMFLQLYILKFDGPNKRATFDHAP